MTLVLNGDDLRPRAWNKRNAAETTDKNLVSQITMSLGHNVICKIF